MVPRTFLQVFVDENYVVVIGFVHVSLKIYYIDLFNESADPKGLFKRFVRPFDKFVVERLKLNVDKNTAFISGRYFDAVAIYENFDSVNVCLLCVCDVLKDG